MSAKMTEIRQKTDAELVTMLTESRAAVATAYVDLKTKEVKHVKAIHNLKRTIARILTIQSERELAQLESTNE